MQTKYTYKEIWLIAYPILISLLMEQMIGMTDTAFLGRVGEIELGASAIAGIFYIVMFMVAFGFSIGAQILIARRNGEQQYKEIGNLFYQGIYFQLGMAAVMFVVCYSFAPVILKRLVSSEHIYDAAMSYLNWRVFGFFFSFTAVMFRAFFLGTTLSNALANGVITEGELSALQSGTFLRADLAYVSYYALDAVVAGSSQTLEDVLLDKGVFTAREAAEAAALVTSSRK